MIDINRQRSAPAPPPTPPQPVSPVQSKPADHHKDNLKSILSTVAILLIAPVIAVLLTSFVFQSYQVDGPSMQTTLFNNDRLIVWKLPKSIARLTHHAYIPKRGDVVVFTEPGLAEFGQDPSKQLIKRVVALPGERVVVKNNILTVYNSQHPEGFQPDASLPYGKVIQGTNLDGEWTIGKNQLFVCGDNRFNSLDSRMFGPINAKNIVGKLVVRILPLDAVKKF